MSARFHYIDYCRAILMLLGIPYHAALMYSRDWGPPQGGVSSFCATLAVVITTFRMPAFFVIAGFFTAMMLGRTPPAAWLRTRLFRLGVPLAAATLTIIPFQMLLVAIYSSSLTAEVLPNWTWHLTHWSQMWISHLWFLDDLIIFSIVAVVAWPILARHISQTASSFDEFSARRASFVGVLCVVAVVGSLVGSASPALSSGHILGGWIFDRLLHGGLFFALGLFFGARRDVFDAWLEWRASRVLTSTVLLVGGIALTLADQMAAARYIVPVAALAGTWLVLAAARRWTTKPSARITFFIDAALPIYLVHHPIIMVLGMATAWIALPLTAKWAAVTVIAGLLSAALAKFLLRYPIIAFLFTGKVMPLKQREQSYRVSLQ